MYQISFNSFSIIVLIALISVKVNLTPRLYIANTSFKFSTSNLLSFYVLSPADPALYEYDQNIFQYANNIKQTVNHN